jgi:hypothetical protein
MSAAYEIHVMFLQESRYYVWTKCEADTSVVLTPASNVLVGIGPQKIAEQATVGNLCALAYVRIM